VLQSTRPWGRDAGKSLAPRTDALFQSTRPWGRDALLAIHLLGTSGFNPRARGGATEGEKGGPADSRVSIHAPVGARQAKHASAAVHGKVSIHAPVGARLIDQVHNLRWSKFQSTRPWGRDTPIDPIEPPALEFQSTRPWGRDFKPFKKRIPLLFQSTRPWGRDLNTPSYCVVKHSFNPRARGGATGGSDGDIRERLCFNPHAATSFALTCLVMGAVSIHAPVRARRGVRMLYNLNGQFQSTRP